MNAGNILESAEMAHVETLWDHFDALVTMDFRYHQLGLVLVRVHFELTHIDRSYFS